MPAAPAGPLLRAAGLGWRYRARPWLFRDLSVEVGAGELLRVRGGNGSGKSTLLRVLAGCLAPRAGEVALAVRPAYLPQLSRSLPAVPVGRLSALLTGRDRPGDPVLAEHLTTRADRLSAGTARRLLLDAVLALPSPLLVLDEPAAGLDAAGVERLAAALAQRLAAGTAVVLADHQALPLAGSALVDLGGTVPEPPAVAVTLAGTGTFRGRPASEGRVHLLVPAGECDALLLEALRTGWSVRAVVPQPEAARASGPDGR